MQETVSASGQGQARRRGAEGLGGGSPQRRRQRHPGRAARARRPSPAAAPAPPEQRVALLIGNTHYKSWGVQLKNPKNDVIAVGRQLRSLGFATTVMYDGTSEQMATAIQAFKDEAAGADWALIYYAGTGIEVDGVNYMIPIEADDRRALSFAREYPQMRLDTGLRSPSKAPSGCAW